MNKIYLKEKKNLDIPNECPDYSRIEPNDDPNVDPNRDEYG